ncbi:hypothetical protein ACTXT7_012608 [Hymenolepis weldensis]
MSPGADNTSEITLSPNSPKNSIQYPVAPVSYKVLPTVISVELANDNMKFHPSIRNSVNVMNLAHSVESSMPKVAPTGTLPSLPCSSNNHSRNPLS